MKAAIVVIAIILAVEGVWGDSAQGYHDSSHTLSVQVPEWAKALPEKMVTVCAWLSEKRDTQQDLDTIFHKIWELVKDFVTEILLKLNWIHHP